MIKLLSAVLFLVLSITALGQDENKIAHTKGRTDILKSKETGIYSFILPDSITSSDVERNNKYYNNYFKVEFNELTNESIIKLMKNDEKSKHLICRFLFASGVEKVIHEGKKMSVEEFFQNYIK
jgi:hypothetical protein